jgi:hypothetical protein
MKEEQPLTQREIGKFEQVLKDIAHRARNDRQIMILLEDEIEQLRRDFEKMKTRVYSGGAIILVLGSVIAWVIEMILR